MRREPRVRACRQYDLEFFAAHIADLGAAQHAAQARLLHSTDEPQPAELELKCPGRGTWRGARHSYVGRGVYRTLHNRDLLSFREPRPLPQYVLQDVHTYDCELPGNGSVPEVQDQSSSCRWNVASAS